MASIPLPALSIRPPEQPNALEAYARLMQMKQQQALMPGQLQAQQQQIQAGQQENEQRAQQIKDSKAATAAMQEWDPKDANAMPGLILKHGGSAQIALSTRSAMIKQQQEFASLTKDQQAIQANKTNLLLGGLQSASEAPDDKLADTLDSTIKDHLQAGNIDPQHAQMGQQLIQALRGGQIDAKTARQQLSIYEKSLMGQKEIQEQALKGAEAAKDTAQAGEATARTGEVKANTAKIQAEMNFYQQKGLAPGVPLDAQEAADWMQKNPGKGPADFMKYKSTLVPAYNFNLQNSGTTGNAADVAKKFGMSLAAFDQAAEKYITTGQLPPSGRGGPSLALNKAIMNRGAELHPGESLAENSAAFKANQASLSSLQKNVDNVDAFERTAGKNLDTFLTTAKKVVDSGSPWINKPLRSIDASGLGGADQAAFNAARTTALTEIAKVLSSANAGSGVLSDSARHEVEGLIGPGATLQQIMSAANILKQDMGNRRESYQQQISDIRGRMKTQPSQQPAQNQPPAAGGFDWNAHPKVNQ